MNTYTIAELKPDMYFSADVMLDNTFCLLVPQTPITQSMINALQDWNFKSVLSVGYMQAESELEEETKKSFVQKENLTEAELLKLHIKTILEQPEAESNKFETISLIYEEYRKYIYMVYTRFSTCRELKYAELYDVVKELCLFVNQNRRFILQLPPAADPENKEFIVNHSMRTTVYSIIIGIQMQTPLSKLAEIGVASVLHDIGMLKFPPQFYMTSKTLTPAERKTLFTHPVLSYEILKSYNFPLSVCLAVLEHHEKEDGTGYPRKLIGNNISLYAKIISVSSSFEAITAPRNHRSARSSYEAMVEMLKNTGKQYDERVIKALLYSMSLYPIGSYVELSNGGIGLVADTNPEDPKNPIVQMLNEKTATGATKFVKSGTQEIKIVHVLNKQETEAILQRT